MVGYVVLWFCGLLLLSSVENVVINTNDLESLTHLYTIVAREVDTVIYSHFMRVFLLLQSAKFYPSTLYDIGSNCIQFTNMARQVWPTTRYFLFESVEYFEELYQIRNESYCLVTLGRTTGATLNFYQNPFYTTGSSYYKEMELDKKENERVFNENSIVQKKSKTLTDAAAECQFPAAKMIKFDIQGAELDVILGSPEAIQTADFLIVEMQHKPYNLGAPTVFEVKPVIESLGFLCTHPYFYRPVVPNSDSDYGFLKIVESDYNIFNLNPSPSSAGSAKAGSRYLLRSQIVVSGKLVTLRDGIVGVNMECQPIGAFYGHDSTFYFEHLGDALFNGQELRYSTEYRIFVLWKSAAAKPIRLYVAITSSGDFELQEEARSEYVQTWVMESVDVGNDAPVAVHVSPLDGMRTVSPSRLFVGPILNSTFFEYQPWINLSSEKDGSEFGCKGRKKLTKRLEMIPKR